MCNQESGPITVIATQISLLEAHNSQLSERIYGPWKVDNQLFHYSTCIKYTAIFTLSLKLGAFESFASFLYSFVQLERALSKQHRCLWKTHDLSWTHSTGKGINKHAWATEVFLLFSVKCTYPWPTKWNSIHDDISVFVLKFSKILSYDWCRSFSHKIKYKILSLFPYAIATNILLLAQVFIVTLVWSLYFYEGFKGFLILFMILNWEVSVMPKYPRLFTLTCFKIIIIIVAFCSELFLKSFWYTDVHFTEADCFYQTDMTQL